MLLGLAALALMSFTLLAQQHAAEKRLAARSDATCVAGACPEGGLGDRAAVRRPAADAMPAPFVQGLADRTVYEAWRAARRAGTARHGHPIA